MQLTELIAALSSPAAYSHAADAVEVRQTHISAVFLVGQHVYKIKKPVNLGFLDFSTLELRKHFCAEEVRLNRRLAHDVYLGVVPINRNGSEVRIEGSGETIEYAVKMQRLPEEATLEKRLQRGTVDADRVKALARKVAVFHAQSASNNHIAEFGKFAVVAGNARENFEQALPHVGRTVSEPVLNRLRQLTDETLAELKPLIEGRAKRGVPRDTHGDLHLDHVYLFPDRAPPNDLVIIDCIEFNERFRFADPVADMAFLVMDLILHGKSDLAELFAEEYFQASGDEEGKSLLPFYTSYRAAVRGKVEGLKCQEPEVPAAAREAAVVRARAHWLVALGQLESSGQKPCLVLVAGLPGSGKSTLAKSLADRVHFELIRSDVVRKQLAGIRATESGRAELDKGIYTPEWSERTYTECLNQAKRLLFEGKRVLVDANFGKEARRCEFLDAAALMGVPAILLRCQASPEVARKRIASREGDASDADLAIYELAASNWEAMGAEIAKVTRVVSMDGTKDDALSQALGVFREAMLI